MAYFNVSENFVLFIVTISWAHPLLAWQHHQSKEHCLTKHSGPVRPLSIDPGWDELKEQTIFSSLWNNRTLYDCGMLNKQANSDIPWDLYRDNRVWFWCPSLVVFQSGYTQAVYYWKKCWSFQSGWSLYPWTGCACCSVVLGSSIVDSTHDFNYFLAGCCCLKCVCLNTNNYGHLESIAFIINFVFALLSPQQYGTISKYKFTSSISAFNVDNLTFSASVWIKCLEQLAYGSSEVDKLNGQKFMVQIEEFSLSHGNLENGDENNEVEFDSNYPANHGHQKPVHRSHSKVFQYFEYIWNDIKSVWPFEKTDDVGQEKDSSQPDEFDHEMLESMQQELSKGCPEDGYYAYKPANSDDSLPHQRPRLMDKMTLPFWYIQLDDGTIPEIRFTLQDTRVEVKNLKKQIVSSLVTFVGHQNESTTYHRTEASLLGAHRVQYRLTTPTNTTAVNISASDASQAGNSILLRNSSSMSTSLITTTVHKTTIDTPFTAKHVHDLLPLVPGLVPVPPTPNEWTNVRTFTSAPSQASIDPNNELTVNNHQFQCKLNAYQVQTITTATTMIDQHTGKRSHRITSSGQYSWAQMISIHSFVRPFTQSTRI